MKFLYLNLLIIISAGFLGTAWAENSLPLKTVNLPFNKEKIFSNTNNGLSFTYNLSNASPKKVVCEFFNAYKSWIEGPIDVSPTFGGNQIIILTTAESQEIGETLSAIHVNNLIGQIEIYDTDYGQVSDVSCFYEN